VIDLWLFTWIRHIHVVCSYAIVFVLSIEFVPLYVSREHHVSCAQAMIVLFIEAVPLYVCYVHGEPRSWLPVFANMCMVPPSCFLQSIVSTSSALLLASGALSLKILHDLPAEIYCSRSRFHLHQSRFCPSSQSSQSPGNPGVGSPHSDQHSPL
jgi:hypothetical protein